MDGEDDAAESMLDEMHFTPAMQQMKNDDLL
jgi:hypothetical protein